MLLPVVAICVIVLAASCLALYAMHRSKPSRLKFTASLLKLASFSIEVESDDHRDEASNCHHPLRTDKMIPSDEGIGPIGLIFSEVESKLAPSVERRSVSARR